MNNAEEELPLEPLDEDGAASRVDPALRWPTEAVAALNDEYHAGAARSSFDLAREVFESYREFRDAALRDPRWTLQGAVAASKEFADKQIPVLEAELAKVKGAIERSHETVSRWVREAVPEPETAIQVAAVSAMWEQIRSTPSIDRLDKVERLIRDGDQATLQAIVFGSPTLTGIPATDVARLTDEVARKVNNARFVKLEALRKLHETSAFALVGVIRFLASDPGTPRARPLPANVRRFG